MAAAEESAATPEVLQEVVVTAERRTSTVQDTPISMTAFSGAELEARGLTSTESLAMQTPGLTIEKDVIGKVVIRGVGTENYTVGSDPGVAIYQDGVYIARSSASMFDFFDTNRAEVLRGPQGTLYGRNATGGVISIVSNEPTDKFEGYGKLDLGDWNTRRFEGVLNAPIGDLIETRWSFLYAEHDGYDKNIFPGSPEIPANPETGAPEIPAISNASSRHVSELDNEALRAGRGQVKVALGDSASLLINGQISLDASLAPANKYFDTMNAYWFNAFPQNQNIPNLRVVSQDFSNIIPGTDRTIPSVGQTNQDALSAKLVWHLGGVDLTSLTAWRKTDFSWLDDGDGYDVVFVNYFQTDHSVQITQDFQLTNSHKDKFDWIAGAYYLSEASKTFLGIPFLYFNPNPSAPYLLWDGVSNTKSYSAYAEGTYSWTDKFKTTIGVRYNVDRKDGYLIYNPFGFEGASPPPEPLSGVWNSFTPKFVADYNFTQDIMGYASATKGFKSGGFNLLAVQAPYSPESLWAYEIGLKTKSFDGRLIANVSAFYYDYTNMQVGKIVDLSAEVANAGKATIKGGEIELRGLPGAGFELNTGIALLDARYDEFLTQDPGFTGIPNAPGALGCGVQVGPPAAANATPNRNVNLAGCQIPRTSKFQGNFGAQWTKPFGDDHLRLRSDYTYRTNQYFTQFDRNEVSQPGYGLLSARASFAGPSDRWSVTVYGDNLANKTYFADVLESGVAAAGTVVPQAIIGTPRTFGVSLQSRF